MTSGDEEDPASKVRDDLRSLEVATYDDNHI